jgi:anti-anti-sigma factor
MRKPADGALEVTYVREARAIRLKGELDLASVGELEVPLAHATDAGGPIVIEMSELRFMDSAGVHALIRTAQQVSERGWCIYLHTDGGIVERVLDLVKADTFPNVHVIHHPGYKEELALKT